MSYDDPKELARIEANLREQQRLASAVFMPHFQVFGIEGPFGWVVPAGFYSSLESPRMWLCISDEYDQEDYEIYFGLNEWRNKPYPNPHVVGTPRYGIGRCYYLTTVLRHAAPHIYTQYCKLTHWSWLEPWTWFPKKGYAEECLRILLNGCMALDPGVWSGDFSSLGKLGIRAR